MTLAQAEDLAARTLAAMAGSNFTHRNEDHAAADRERVASDLAGLREHRGLLHACLRGVEDLTQDCPDAARYAAGLVRTAALYGITPTEEPA